jgi:hypothetical protein
MASLRLFLAVVLTVSLITWAVPPTNAADPPLGILTLADRAHLDESIAFPGLSVFEGERLSTDELGRLGIRMGRSTLALGANTEATLFKITGGMHVDLSAGILHFSSSAEERVEIHVAEAMLRPANNQPTQAVVTVFAPKVLQITTRQGSLNFSYRDEFRNLPEGQTYRIYLDAPADPQDAAVAGAASTGISSKVVYFIVGAGAGSGAAWGIHLATASENAPISPAKP